MKHWVLCLLLLAGCASAPRTAPDRIRVCPVVRVDNRAFEDVVVHTVSPRRRLGLVTGFTRHRFTVCQPRNVAAAVHVHAVGNAFDGVLRANSSEQMYDGQRYDVVITPRGGGGSHMRIGR